MTRPVEGSGRSTKRSRLHRQRQADYIARLEAALLSAFAQSHNLAWIDEHGPTVAEVAKRRQTTERRRQVQQQRYEPADDLGGRVRGALS